jgi:putative ABC transport system permease protein
MMFARLALGNVRKSARDYAIYFVTLVLGVAVFYAFNTMANQADFFEGDTREVMQTVGLLLHGLTYFLAVVMGFLMVYANNFLMRRRKQELGLYQVLGMHRRQVSLVLTLELLFASALSFAIGIACGVLLSQILVFVTAHLFEATVSNFHFFFSFDALLTTLVCFGVIFFVMLFFNMRSLRKLRLVELMGARHENEKVRVRGMGLSTVLFVGGLALIIVAYVRLLHDGLPVSSGTMPAFYVTTALVVLGTLILFFGLGGLFLAIASRRQSYWRDLNMFTTRELAARINTTCVSLAVISLVLFLAITSVTAGMGICNALNEGIEKNTPYDATLTQYSSTDEANQKVDLIALLKNAGVDTDALGHLAQSTVYYNLGSESGVQGITLFEMAQETGATVPLGMDSSDAASTGLYVMSESDYNALRSILGMSAIELNGEHYLITCSMDNDEIVSFYNKALDSGHTITIDGQLLSPLQTETITDASATFVNSNIGLNSGTLVVPDAVVSAARGEKSYSESNLEVMYAEGTTTEEGDSLMEAAAAVLEKDPTVYTSLATREGVVKASESTTGMVSYLAIYIGFVLVVSCAAILAIQQLSGASDSASRYRTLSELGCSDRLIYRSLLFQTLLSFLFPLIVALAHSVVALKCIIDVIKVFGQINILSSSLMAVSIFLVVYGGYFFVTYRTARSVVHGTLVGACHSA